MHPHSEDSAIHHRAVGPSAAHICVFFFNLKLIPSEMQVCFFLIVLIKQPYFFKYFAAAWYRRQHLFEGLFLSFSAAAALFTDSRQGTCEDSFWWFLFFFFSKNHTVLFLNPDETIIIFFVWLLRSFVELWNESQERLCLWKSIRLDFIKTSKHKYSIAAFKFQYYLTLNN